MFDSLLELFERKSHARPDDRKRGWRDRIASVVGDDDDHGNDRHRSTRRDWDDDDDDRSRRSDRHRGRFDSDFD